MKLSGTIAALGLALAAGLTGSAAIAQAEPMTFRDCISMDGEHRKLIAEGVGKHLAKGPEWAKANLSEEQIKKVKLLIAAKEAIAFRCNAKEMQAFKKRMQGPAFAKWRKVEPPLPSRNPKFVQLNISDAGKAAN